MMIRSHEHRRGVEKNSIWKSKVERPEAGRSSKYLVGSQQGGASVHVILRLEDINHLIRVELEHALHLFLF